MSDVKERPIFVQLREEHVPGLMAGDLLVMRTKEGRQIKVGVIGKCLAWPIDVDDVAEQSEGAG